MNSIFVCFSSDDYYAPYLAVAIKSLIENSSADNFYEAYIIDENISEENKIKIKHMERDNFYISFIKINSYLKNIDKNAFFLHQHFTISTYYRFFIPDIFKNFKKILYLDVDIIVLEDIAKLYNNKTDKMILASHDTEMIRSVFLEKIGDYTWKNYLENKLKIRDPYDYFQAGVLLFDIEKLIEFNFKEKCIEKLIELKDPIYVDQCVLNSLCHGNIDFIDLSWNVEWHVAIFNKNLENKLPINSYKEYIKAYNNPKLIHYAGYIKPWTNPNYPKANLWWKYARMTQFYEDIIYKNKTINNNIKSAKEINRFSIADFILSIGIDRNYVSIIFFGIRLNIKIKPFVDNKFYENNKDKIFSIYENDKYIRITFLGIKLNKNIK